MAPFKISNHFSDLVIQCRKRNNNGETENSLGFFQRPWSEYRDGFGELKSDYWLGLERLHNITSNSGSTWSLEVRIDRHLRYLFVFLKYNTYMPRNYHVLIY